MNWENWDEVRQYLMTHNKQIPNDIWQSFSKKESDNYDYLRLKEKHFKEIMLTKDGSIKGVKILFNALRKYFCMINKIILLREDTKNMYVYNGKHFEAQPVTSADSFLYEHVLEHDDLKGLDTSDYGTFKSNLLAQPRASKEELIKGTIGRLNFTNGVLNTKTMELEKHNPDYFFTYLIDYPFVNENDPTPNWDKLMNFVCRRNEDYIETLEFYLGYILSMDNTKTFQYFLMLVGTGSNGKSFLIDVMKKMISPALYTTQKMKKMSDQRFASSSMEDKIAIFTDDEEKDVFEKPEFIKELVGGNETMNVEKKYCDSYEMQVRAKPIITTNYLPYLPDTSLGFQRRFLIVPFEANTMVAVKEDLIKDTDGDKKMFYPEFPAIIKKCLNRYFKAKKEGFIVCPEIKALQSKLVRFSAQTSFWFEHNLVYTGWQHDRIPIRFLYDLYDSSIESGKLGNKKKIGNFKIELEKWLDGFRRTYNENNEDGICTAEISERLHYCRIYMDLEKEILSVLDKGQATPDFKNIKNGRYRNCLVGFVTTTTKRDLSGINREEDYDDEPEEEKVF